MAKTAKTAQEILDMVVIPSGTFIMGSPVGEKGRSGNEGPQHQVTVPAFLMSKYPITQAQYQKVMGDNPSHFKGDGRPVEGVTWFQAVEFCQHLRQQTGQEY
ncbi:MAG TPA: formylglycine-generating enzyme family protein, partial [Coleofasciculaceae cyanobacterium]